MTGLKRIHCTAFVALLAGFLLTGCVESPAPANTSQTDSIYGNPNDLDRIRQRGKLVALTDNSSTSYFIYRGQPMGYEYELLTQFADHLGVDLEVVIVPDMDSVFHWLNRGQGDVIAANLTITKGRARAVDFTDHHLKTRQVLIQRKPGAGASLIKDPNDLAGRKVHVRKNSSFFPRLKALSEEIGAEIEIVPVPGDLDTEELIEMVSKGTIEFTVADENVARLNQLYYPNIDGHLAISFPQRIAWAVRKTNPELRAAMNSWIAENRESRPYRAVYTKYFQARTQHRNRVTSDYSSLSGQRLSDYDELIREFSDSIGWDWRLVAAMIYTESQFKPDIKSWAGAVGLMQVMPITAANFGVENVEDPRQNVMVGVRLLSWLDNYWREGIPDSLERQKFVLAAYNVGLGHVIDARRLAEKHGANPDRWDGEVDQYLLMKSKPAYYNDPVVRHGYCRGSQPYAYVKSVLKRFEAYRKLIPA